MAYATTPFHGKFARVEKNNTAMAFTDGWNITTTLDMADISAQGDYWKTALPGMGSWSGSFSGHFVAGNTEQKAIYDNIIAAQPGTKLTDIKFLLDVDTNAFTGNIYITSVAINTTVGDKVGFTVNFQGDGALTLTNAA